MIKRLFAFLTRKFFKRVFIFSALLLLVILLSNWWIVKSTRSKMFSDVKLISGNNVGLVLGASKTLRNGHVNLFFKYRIEAAAKLFKAGKIKHIVVSGDNHKKEYDEATDMRNALMEQGVPDSCITLDYAGFRTLDSVMRCWKVFGQKKFTIISQAFHNQRAVFIARYYGLDVVAFNAQDVPSHFSFKTRMREYIAKFKAVIDLYLIHKQPRFLGEKVSISGLVD